MTIAKNSVRAGSLLLVVGYVTLVLLYVLPENPLKRQLQPVLRIVVGRLFHQRWGMFAPSPPRAEMTLLARCLRPGWASPWIDLTSSLKGNRGTSWCSADHRLLAYLLEILRRELRMRERDTAQAEHSADDARSSVKRLELDVRMAHIGSVACADVLAGQPFERVELKYRQVPLALWPGEPADLSLTSEVVLGTFDAVPRRIQPGHFQAEREP
ncbi:MAG: DUF5819 family protein [Myxococcaceae bacterium]|nr:DUF5819 family protein [Myxococcaceae bacterium]